jgi:hypothetical protein
MSQDQTERQYSLPSVRIYHLDDNTEIVDRSLTPWLVLTEERTTRNVAASSSDWTSISDLTRSSRSASQVSSVESVDLSATSSNVMANSRSVQFTVSKGIAATLRNVIAQRRRDERQVLVLSIRRRKALACNFIRIKPLSLPT